MDEIIIRDAKLEDLKQTAEIVVRGWKTAYRGIIDDEYLDNLSIDSRYQKMLKNYKENGFIVAEKDNEIVGFCRYKTGNDYGERFPSVDCELCALYVKPEFKRKGIGKKLVNYVKEEFKKAGFSQMILWCFKENYPSRAFYEKIGGGYCGENTIEIENKEYKEVAYTYNLCMPN